MKYECLKVIRQPFLIMLFGLLIVMNGFLFIYEMHANNQEGYSPADMAAVYRQMTAEGADQPQETEVWLRQKIIQIEEGRLDESWELYNSVLEQTESINSYGDYWSSLMSGGNSISVLFANESSYSGRNIARTRQAYQHLQGLAVKAECSAGILAVIGTGASDLLVLGFVFCLLLILVPREKEEGYHRLTIPMKLGGSDQAAAKYLILIAAAVLMTGICFGMNCLLAQLTVGLGNPGRSIQSVYGCQTCPYSFCVGDYLIVCLIAKCVGMAAVMSIFFLLAIIGDGMLQAAVSAAAFLAFSFLLWSGISPHSWLNILHYFNLIHLLDTQAVLGDYRNINLAGYPVNQIIICMVLAGISIPGSAVIGCRLFGSSSKIRISLRHSAQTMPNSIMKHRIQPKHLSGFERYKLLAANGGLALLILLSAVSIILTRREPLFMNSQTAIYENYCRQIEGKLSPEKLEFIEQEKSKFDEGRLNMPEQHAALDQVYKQYLKLEERKKAGLEVAFFSQSGWERYLGEYGRQKDCQMAGLFMLILLLSSFRYVTMEKDSHMDQIISTVYRGSALVCRAKIRVMAVYAVILLAIAFLPYTVRVFTYYQMGNWTEGMCSLLMIGKQWGCLKIWMFFILYWLCRIVGALASAAVIYLCGSLTKNRVAALLLSFILLLLPAGTYLLGVTGEWGLLPFVTGHAILFFGLA